MDLEDQQWSDNSFKNMVARSLLFVKSIYGFIIMILIFNNMDTQAYCKKHTLCVSSD